VPTRAQIALGEMDMAIKEQLLFLWLLLVVVSVFLIGHFWSCVVYALQKATAFGLPLLVFSKFAGGIAIIHFFS
jgi:hypothetical protein